MRKFSFGGYFVRLSLLPTSTPPALPERYQKIDLAQKLNKMETNNF